MKNLHLDQKIIVATEEINWKLWSEKFVPLMDDNDIPLRHILSAIIEKDPNPFFFPLS